jgi:hypothetical protein
VADIFEEEYGSVWDLGSGNWEDIARCDASNGLIKFGSLHFSSVIAS